MRLHNLARSNLLVLCILNVHYVGAVQCGSGVLVTGDAIAVTKEILHCVKEGTQNLTDCSRVMSGTAQTGIGAAILEFYSDQTACHSCYNEFYSDMIRTAKVDFCIGFSDEIYLHYAMCDELLLPARTAFAICLGTGIDIMGYPSPGVCGAGEMNFVTVNYQPGGALMVSALETAVSSLMSTYWGKVDTIIGNYYYPSSSPTPLSHYLIDSASDPLSESCLPDFPCCTCFRDFMRTIAFNKEAVSAHCSSTGTSIGGCSSASKIFPNGGSTGVYYQPFCSVCYDSPIVLRARDEFLACSGSVLKFDFFKFGSDCSANPPIFTQYQYIRPLVYGGNSGNVYDYYAAAFDMPLAVGLKKSVSDKCVRCVFNAMTALLSSGGVYNACEGEVFNTANPCYAALPNPIVASTCMGALVNTAAPQSVPGPACSDTSLKALWARVGHGSFLSCVYAGKAVRTDAADPNVVADCVKTLLGGTSYMSCSWCVIDLARNLFIAGGAEGTAAVYNAQYLADEIETATAFTGVYHECTSSTVSPPVIPLAVDQCSTAWPIPQSAYSGELLKILLSCVEQGKLIAQGCDVTGTFQSVPLAPWGVGLKNFIINAPNSATDRGCARCYEDFIGSILSFMTPNEFINSCVNAPIEVCVTDASLALLVARFNECHGSFTLSADMASTGSDTSCSPEEVLAIETSYRPYYGVMKSMLNFRTSVPTDQEILDFMSRETYKVWGKKASANGITLAEALFEDGRVDGRWKLKCSHGYVDLVRSMMAISEGTKTDCTTNGIYHIACNQVGEVTAILTPFSGVGIDTAETYICPDLDDPIHLSIHPIVRCVMNAANSAAIDPCLDQSVFPTTSASVQACSVRYLELAVELYNNVLNPGAVVLAWVACQNPLSDECLFELTPTFETWVSQRFLNPSYVFNVMPVFSTVPDWTGPLIDGGVPLYTLVRTLLAGEPANSWSGDPTTLLSGLSVTTPALGDCAKDFGRAIFQLRSIDAKTDCLNSMDGTRDLCVEMIPALVGYQRCSGYAMYWPAPEASIRLHYCTSSTPSTNKFVQEPRFMEYLLKCRLDIDCASLTATGFQQFLTASAPLGEYATDKHCASCISAFIAWIDANEDRIRSGCFVGAAVETQTRLCALTLDNGIMAFQQCGGLTWDLFKGRGNKYGFSSTFCTLDQFKEIETKFRPYGPMTACALGTALGVSGGALTDSQLLACVSAASNEIIATTSPTTTFAHLLYRDGDPVNPPAIPCGSCMLEYMRDIQEAADSGFIDPTCYLRQSASTPDSSCAFSISPSSDPVSEYYPYCSTCLASGGIERALEKYTACSSLDLVTEMVLTCPVNFEREVQVARPLSALVNCAYLNNPTVCFADYHTSTGSCGLCYSAFLATFRKRQNSLPLCEIGVFSSECVSDLSSSKGGAALRFEICTGGIQLTLMPTQCRYDQVTRPYRNAMTIVQRAIAATSEEEAYAVGYTYTQDQPYRKISNQNCVGCFQALAVDVWRANNAATLTRCQGEDGLGYGCLYSLSNVPLPLGRFRFCMGDEAYFSSVGAFTCNGAFPRVPMERAMLESVLTASDGSTAPGLLTQALTAVNQANAPCSACYENFVADFFSNLTAGARSSCSRNIRIPECLGGVLREMLRRFELCAGFPMLSNPRRRVDKEL
jgi:hypothetical protein